MKVFVWERSPFSNPFKRIINLATRIVWGGQRGNINTSLDYLFILISLFFVLFWLAAMGHHERGYVELSTKNFVRIKKVLVSTIYDIHYVWNSWIHVRNNFRNRNSLTGLQKTVKCMKKSSLF